MVPRRRRGRLAGRALRHPLYLARSKHASLTAHWHDKGADWRGLAHTPGTGTPVVCAVYMSRATIELATTATADGLSSIALKICSPPSPIAAAVFAHGGCFSDGCSQSHPAVTEALAGIGIASVSSTYRQGAAHPHPTAQHDLACVAEFARRRWPSLPLGVIGSSSGGWHALALSRTIEGMRFCVALCPVADPLLRAEYLRECVQGTAAVAGWRVCHEPSVAGRMLAKQLGAPGRGAKPAAPHTRSQLPSGAPRGER